MCLVSLVAMRILCSFVFTLLPDVRCKTTFENSELTITDDYVEMYKFTHAIILSQSPLRLRT